MSIVYMKCAGRNQGAAAITVYPDKVLIQIHGQIVWLDTKSEINTFMDILRDGNYVIEAGDVRFQWGCGAREGTHQLIASLFHSKAYKFFTLTETTRVFYELKDALAKAGTLAPKQIVKTVSQPVATPVQERPTV